MGVSNSLEIFQDIMNEFFRGFEFIWSYINYLLIITKGDCSGHLEKLELTIQNLNDNRQKCNIKNSFCVQTEMGYLGFWVNRNGIQLINNKLEAIVNMIPPKIQKQVSEFIGLVKCYRDMWSRQSHLLQPLIALS